MFDKLKNIQNLGKSLMLPISILPIAGILFRFGSPDLLNIKYISEAGSIILKNLPLLFAMGVAIGFAKDNHGSSALAATVGYLIMTSILFSINSTIDTGVLGGIVIGIISGVFYNKYRNIKLPEYLSFFGGRRFIPIITGIASVFIGVCLAYVWPPIQNMIDLLNNKLVSSGFIGVFLYGIINRFLIITGLHHILNNAVWFVLGSFKGHNGIIYHGDISRFMAGDKNAGIFTTGFYPIFMFGLPAACLAIYKNALSENKKRVSGILFSMALTALLTGVTEPVEFSFLFLAPFLYLIHAILTGISFVIVYFLNIHQGFLFSAGLIDYLLFFKLGVNSIFIIPVGILFFAIYYFIFDFFIKKYDLKVLGRDVEVQNEISSKNLRSIEYIDALGGAENILSIDSCTTRLRLILNNSAKIDVTALKTCGAKGVVPIGKDALQIIIGTRAEILASEIKESLKVILQDKNSSNSSDSLITYRKYASDIINLCGGKENISSISVVAMTRLRIVIINDDLILKERIKDVNSIIKFIDDPSNIKQVYIGSKVDIIYKEIQNFL